MLQGTRRTKASFDGPTRGARYVAALVALAAIAGGCGGDDEAWNRVPTSSSAVAPTPSATPSAKVFAARSGCDAIKVYADGAPAGEICADDAEKSGLTVIDLSDTWTPRVFAPDPTTKDAPAYRAKYLDLARNPSADLSLYGVAPTMTVLFARLADPKRIACDSAIDRSALDASELEWANAPDGRSAAATLKRAATGASLEVAQAELVCEGFLKSSSVTGAMNGSTSNAIEAFHRRHMMTGFGFDGETLTALSLGGDELAFRAVLRGLRERVADAAGLLEDGSASETHELVVDRDPDLSRFTVPVRGPMENGAPDLIGRATDAAARALGWTAPEKARAFYASLGKAGMHTARFAVALPDKPSYYGASMDLHVEIDRGDVFYETPALAAIEKKKLGDVHGPTFVLYAKDGDKSVALMRWATTIGGWKKERVDDGEFALKYKESDVGERVWRQIVAAPAWMPPDSTPETDLLHEASDGSFALKKDLIQPGYGNAYGLVMLIHDEQVMKGDKVTWVDHGIRTHGSVDYRSIQRGESHGCHRLYNHLALRLSGFLLQHRTNVRRGKMRAGYHRTLEWSGAEVDVDVPERGYLYELDPPVPVRVLEGHIAGGSLRPVSTAIPIQANPTKKG